VEIYIYACHSTKYQQQYNETEVIIYDTEHLIKKKKKKYNSAKSNGNAIITAMQ
jgi:hypothetical protein